MIAPSTLSKLIEEQQERCAQTLRYLAGSYYNTPHVNKFGYPDAFFRLYELNFRSMRVINLENLHILTQNHIFTIPIDDSVDLLSFQKNCYDMVCLMSNKQQYLVFSFSKSE
jgi:hypothetical protein